jgi:hypothetical protein
MDFQFEKGKKLSEKISPKDNLAILQTQLLNVAYFFAKGESEFYDAVKSDLEKSEEIVKKNKAESPEYAFAIAEIKMLNGFISAAYGERLSAVWQIRQAYNLLENNIKKYPQYLPHYKSMGLLKVMLGSVPEQYHWALNLIGLSGSVATGKKYLEKVKKSGGFYALEAEIFSGLAAAYLLTDEENAIMSAEKLIQQKKPLPLFAAALIFYKCEKSDEALTALNKIPTDEGRYKLQYSAYLRADMSLSKGEYETAEALFTEFLEQNKGENFIKDSYLKILFCRYLSGKGQFESYFDSIKSSGFDYTDADKHALAFAKRKKLPNKILLEARLKTDGGYYEEALLTLGKTDPVALLNIDDKTEFYYRKGRILHKLHRFSDAETAYAECMTLGETLPRYFAANAALQLGYIYKDIHKLNEKAKFFFEKALAYPKHEYKNSIDQKAKTALNMLQK